jgi:hypothetical protein
VYPERWEKMRDEVERISRCTNPSRSEGLVGLLRRNTPKRCCFLFFTDFTRSDIFVNQTVSLVG